MQYNKRVNVAQRTFEIVQKSRSREHGDIIISHRQERVNVRTYIRTYLHIRRMRVHVRASPETFTCEVPRDVSRKLQLTLCKRMAS